MGNFGTSRFAEGNHWKQMIFCDYCMVPVKMDDIFGNKKLQPDVRG
jgi:hypothetical protein